MPDLRGKKDKDWHLRLPKECPACGGPLFYGQCKPCREKAPKEPPKPSDLPPDQVRIDYDRMYDPKLPQAPNSRKPKN